MSANASFASEEPAYRRATLSLDGFWDFAFEGPTARLTGEGHAVRSPGIWQTQFPSFRNAPGTGRYRRLIAIPARLGGPQNRAGHGRRVP